MVLLDSLETINATANGRWKRLDIARGATDEVSKFTLDHGNERRVLREEGRRGDAIEILCGERVSHL